MSFEYRTQYVPLSHDLTELKPPDDREWRLRDFKPIELSRVISMSARSGMETGNQNAIHSMVVVWELYKELE